MIWAFISVFNEDQTNWFNNKLRLSLSLLLALVASLSFNYPACCKYALAVCCVALLQPFWCLRACVYESLCVDINNNGVLSLHGQRRRRRHNGFMDCTRIAEPAATSGLKSPTLLAYSRFSKIPNLNAIMLMIFKWIRNNQEMRRSS